jgi:hypothetical protein
MVNEMKRVFFITTLIVLAIWSVMPQPRVGRAASVSAIDMVQFKVGSELGWALAENCSIVSGTVLKIGPLTKDAKVKDSNAALHARVDVRIDEWLWNQRSDLGSLIQLDQSIVPEKRKLSSEGRSVWDDVEVQPGARLIVALRRNQNAPRKYVFVISDVNLFPAISIALMWHRQYLSNPSSLVSAPELANESANPFFIGYFGSYLWRGGSFGNRDEEAIALGKLLTRISSVPGSSGLIRVALQRYVMSDSKPLSRFANWSITESLVIAGASENLKLAEQAITLLIRLAQEQKLEMRPFLTADRSRRLSMNFRELVQSGKVDKNHAAFDSQLTKNL